MRLLQMFCYILWTLHRCCAKEVQQLGYEELSYPAMHQRWHTPNQHSNSSNMHCRDVWISQTVPMQRDGEDVLPWVVAI